MHYSPSLLIIQYTLHSPSWTLLLFQIKKWQVSEINVNLRWVPWFYGHVCMAFFRLKSALVFVDFSGYCTCVCLELHMRDYSVCLRNCRSRCYGETNGVHQRCGVRGSGGTFQRA